MLAAGNHPIVPKMSSYLNFPLWNECYLGYFDLSFIWTTHTTPCAALCENIAVFKGYYLCHNGVSKVNVFINSENQTKPF